MSPSALSLVFALPAVALSPEHTSPEPAPSPIVFHCKFESDDWFETWGLKERPRNTDIVPTDPDRRFSPLSGKALRVKVGRGGHYGTSIEYKFGKLTGAEPEEIYFRYFLRLGDDWSPVAGGKLPGISGTYGRAGWGGRRVDGTDGWSARGLFEAADAAGRTSVGYYCYHADMNGRYGSHWPWDKSPGRGLLERNRWYRIDQYVRMNTPEKNDGVLRAWVDGAAVFEKSDVRMRDVASLKIEAVWLNVYHGGRQPAEGDHHLYIDDVTISRAPLGEPKKP